MASSFLRNEAQSGFAAAAAYDAGRPAYSPEVVDQLLERLSLKGVQHAKVLDLAAGTGKFTEALCSRPEQFNIVAIEPHNDMREQLSRKALDRVTVLNGSAEHMDGVEDGPFDGVIAAQVLNYVKMPSPVLTWSAVFPLVRSRADGRMPFRSTDSLQVRNSGCAERNSTGTQARGKLGVDLEY